MSRAAVAALVVVLAGVLAGAAAAHPRGVASTPAAGAVVARAPAAVVVRLSEPADPVGEGISVRGPDGSSVARGPVVVKGSTLTRAVDAHARGSYVVEWLVVGDDSHPARGAFVFSVGEPSRAALPGHVRAGLPLEALGRWLSLFGYALGFGVPFAALVSGGMTRKLWRLVSAGIVLMLVAEPVALLGQTATLAPSRAFDPGLAGDVLLTSYGHAASLRLGAALGLWALAGAMRQSSARAQWSIPAAGVAVALAQAETAHRIDGIPGPPATIAAAAHVVAFGAWFGGVAVAVAEPRAGRLARPAALAALLLVTTGAGLLLAHIRTPGELVETAYGATLAVKLGLTACVLALGAMARHRAELAVALGVLGAASLLVSLVPPL